MDLNRVVVAGRLCRDVELKHTPKGTAVAKFSVATNRKWKSESGELKEEVTFVEIDAFGRTAENIGQYFKKGSSIYIEGRLKLDQWTDKQTNKPRTRLGVLADSFQFVGGKSDGGGSAAPARAESAPATSSGTTEAKAEKEDDSTPF